MGYLYIGVDILIVKIVGSWSKNIKSYGTWIENTKAMVTDQSTMAIYIDINI